MELVAPHRIGQIPYTDTDYHTLRIEKVRFAVSDLAACKRFFSDVRGNAQ